MGKTRGIGLAERAKRIETIRQSLREARDGVEVAVGQLSYLGSDPLEVEQTRETIDKELDWLEQMVNDQMAHLVRLVSQTDHREVSEIVSSKSVLEQATDLLYSKRVADNG